MFFLGLGFLGSPWKERGRGIKNMVFAIYFEGLTIFFLL